MRLPLLLRLPSCSQLCSLTRSPSSSITQVLLFHRFGRVIRGMLWTPRLIGRLKKLIALWVVESFGTTSTSWRLVMMVNGLMVGSFLLPLALLPLFPNPNVDWSLTIPDTAISMWCIWILLLVIVSQLVGFVMPSSLLIEPLDTIELLASRLFNQNAFSWQFASFALRLVCLLAVSTVTVMLSFPAWQYQNISSTTIPKLSLLRPSVSPPMVLLSLTGRLWYIWLGPISRKNRFLAPFGSMRFHTPIK